VRFGRVNVAEAVGAVLAHSMRVGGRTFRKGRVLSAADVEALVGLLVAVSEFAAAAGDALEALDLNPVIVHPRGEGVSVVDAGIVARRVEGVVVKRD